MTQQKAYRESQQGAVIRLYRGLSRAYRPGPFDKVQAMQGTNFTDCPMAALTYARGRNGVLLVVDLPEETDVHKSEALWFSDGPGPKRIMLWGAPFDPYIVAEIPAKELRAEVRKKGVRALSDSEKSRILVSYLERRISGTSNDATGMAWPYGLIPRQS